MWDLALPEFYWHKHQINQTAGLDISCTSSVLSYSELYFQEDVSGSGCALKHHSLGLHNDLCFPAAAGAKGFKYSSSNASKQKIICGIRYCLRTSSKSSCKYLIVLVSNCETQKREILVKVLWDASHVCSAPHSGRLADGQQIVSLLQCNLHWFLVWKLASSYFQALMFSKEASYLYFNSV